MAESGIENMSDQASDVLSHPIAKIEPLEEKDSLIEHKEKDANNQGTIITEGKAQVHYAGAEDNVFYNPVQEFNRDLSIAVLREFALNQIKERDKSFVGETFLKPGESYENGLNVLEALSASGLRSIRYAKEVGGIKNIVANDLSSSAVESITQNSQRNQVSHLITPKEGDASLVNFILF